MNDAVMKVLDFLCIDCGRKTEKFYKGPFLPVRCDACAKDMKAWNKKHWPENWPGPYTGG